MNGSRFDNMQLLIEAYDTKENAKIFKKRLEEILLNEGGLVELNKIYPISFQEQVQGNSDTDLSVVLVDRFDLGYTAHFVCKMQQSAGNGLMITVYFIRFSKEETEYEKKELQQTTNLLSEYIAKANPTR